MAEAWELTGRDRELCRLECELQNATHPKQLEGMVRAYALAKRFGYERGPGNVTVPVLLALETDLALLIEPAHVRYRVGPATFMDGGRAAPAVEIEGRMHRWAGWFLGRVGSPLQRYREYEYTHPRADGNGRNGLCTWSIDTLWETGKWPTRLPPEVFGPNAQSVHTQHEMEGIFGR